MIIKFDRRYMCWNAGALQYAIKSIATPCFRTIVRKTVNFSDTNSRGEAVISCGAQSCSFLRQTSILQVLGSQEKLAPG